MMNTVRLSVFLALVVVLSMAAWSPVGAQDGDDVLAAIAAEYPRVDGSTSAMPLQKVLAATIYGVSWQWTTYGYEPNYFVMAGLTPQDFAYPAIHASVRFVNRIYHSGTHESYVYLINDETDFILVARVPSVDELAAAEIAGITLDVQPVARDAFVFLTHTANPVDTLTLDQLRGIYTGDITSWTEFGVTELIEPAQDSEVWVGDQATNTIHPYTRDPNSGSQELMESLVMGDTPMISSQDMIMSNMGAPILAVSYDSWGIGYSVFFYASFMHPAPTVKLIGVDGVMPTSATIADQSYPLVADVYAVVRADMPPDSPAVLLRDWLLTPDGQAAIASSGYVPLAAQ